MQKSIWVFCENAASGVREVALELLGEASRLARNIGADVRALKLGAQPEPEVCAQLCQSGADEVVWIDDPALEDAEELRCAGEICALARREMPTILLVGATAFGRSMAPRVAARLRTGLTADCTHLDIDAQTGLLLQTRPAFGGHLLATIVCPDALPQMATVRARVFPVPERDAARPVRVRRVSACGARSPVRLLESSAREEGVNLADYETLVCVGQGIGGAENIRRAAALAERLGGTLAATRPMVDAGILPYARQVGQTGRSVAPKLYLALGVSGALQHMAGVSAATLVAVNTDPDAPIFQSADFGIVQDCGAFLDEALAQIAPLRA